jgi:hypothetical protein
LTYLNQSLPEDKKILYKAFDMSRAAKTFVFRPKPRTLTIVGADKM